MKKTKWIEKKYTLTHRNLTNIDESVENILQKRNISMDDEIQINPFDMQDMDKAVDRILRAIENKEKIYIYGDYDVDGITSVSLLYLAISELDADINFYIPLRDEGYGLNKDAIKQLSEEGCKLLISVDCGINSLEEINFGNELGIDFIITDHHEILGELPNALAIINPKREENKYSFKYLAGVGTAYFLVLALFSKKNKMSDVEKFLDIVAIGTVADVVPLVHDNRKFVQKGLQIFNETKWTGIKHLLFKVFGENYLVRKYTSYDIGYVIAPIFNAAGRLEDAKQAVSLLIEEDPYQCLSIIEKLMTNNINRKAIQKNIYEMCIKKINREKLYKKSVILVADKEFHHGVIGIVASKILDKYFKPTIIMEINEKDGTATASCRSVPDVNIAKVLAECSDILVKYGGHSGAAGFTIKIEHIEEFYDRVCEMIKQPYFIKNIEIEEILPPYKICYSFLKDLELLEPFGSHNHTPIFAMLKCNVQNLRYTKNSYEHIIMDIVKDNYVFKNSIFFNGGDYYDLIAKNKFIDIAFKLNIDTFKGKYYYKISIEDVKPSSDNTDIFDTPNKFGKDFKLPFETVCYTKRHDVDNPLRLNFEEDKAYLIRNRFVIDTLDTQTSNLLQLLNKKFGYNFKVNLKDVIHNDENNILILEIDRDRKFKSTAIKDNLIFRDIKKHLIGNFNYNSIQSKVLANIFKNHKKTVAVMEYGRGVSTLIDTVKIYCEYTNKKIFISCASEFPTEDYDFYIFINPTDFSKISEIKSENILVISNKDIEINDFEKIIDSYVIPENILIFNHTQPDDKRVCINKFTPSDLKIEILNNLEKYAEIYATEDVKIYF